jgi:hypothetical protein
MAYDQDQMVTLNGLLMFIVFCGWLYHFTFSFLLAVPMRIIRASGMALPAFIGWTDLVEVPSGMLPGPLVAAKIGPQDTTSVKLSNVVAIQ